MAYDGHSFEVGAGSTYFTVDSLDRRITQDYYNQLLKTSLGVTGTVLTDNVEIQFISVGSGTTVQMRHTEEDAVGKMFRSLMSVDQTSALNYATGLFRSHQLSSLDVTSWLFFYLNQRDLLKRDEVIFTIKEIGDPIALTKKAMEEHNKGIDEIYITLVNSIVSDWGDKTYEGLRYFCENVKGREIEYFYDSIFHKSVSVAFQIEMFNILISKNNKKILEHIAENIAILPSYISRDALIAKLKQHSVNFEF